MNNRPEQHDEDANWLATLAGKPGTPDEGLNTRQASLLRAALQHRQAQLIRTIPQADAKLLSEILSAVHDEQHKRQGYNPSVKNKDLASTVNPAKSYPSKRLSWVWGGAIAVIFATTLWLNNGDDESIVLRGQEGTILVDNDPDARLAQLKTLLERAGAAPQVHVEKSGAIVIVFTEKPEVLDALNAERIYPRPKNGRIVIVIEKPATKRN